MTAARPIQISPCAGKHRNSTASVSSGLRVTPARNAVAVTVTMSMGSAHGERQRHHADGRRCNEASRRRLVERRRIADVRSRVMYVLACHGSILSNIAAAKHAASAARVKFAGIGAAKRFPKTISGKEASRLSLTHSMLPRCGG